MLPGMLVETWPSALGRGRRPAIDSLTAPCAPPSSTTSSRVSIRTSVGRALVAHGVPVSASWARKTGALGSPLAFASRGGTSASHYCFLCDVEYASPPADGNLVLIYVHQPEPGLPYLYRAVPVDP